jgi:serine/threonine protein kinase
MPARAAIRGRDSPSPAATPSTTEAVTPAGTDSATGWLPALMVRPIPPALAADPRRMRALRSEVARLHDVRHTNLVSVIGFNKVRSAVLCEAIPGATLREVLGTVGRLELTAALVLYDDCLAGLQALHAVGVLHRDVRPDAILVESTGVVLLRDVGMPAPPDAEGDPWGTPRYTPPEVAATARPSAAGDVYAATAVFVEAVSGRQLRAGPDTSLQQQVHEAIVDAALPIPVQALVMQALAEDPAARRSDIADCRQHLDETARRLAGTDWRKTGRRLLAAATSTDARPALPRTARSPRRRTNSQRPGAHTKRAAAVPAVQVVAATEQDAAAARMPGLGRLHGRSWIVRGHTLATWQIVLIAVLAAVVFFVAASAAQMLTSTPAR